MRDDGYDIADYFDVNPNFGTLDDFRAFLDAAHERNLRVITELVINHTSDQNPWFQKSRRAVAATGAVAAGDDRGSARPGSPTPATAMRPRLQGLLCLERHAGKIQGRANHLQRFRNIELGVGPVRESLLLASVLFASAGPEF